MIDRGSIPGGEFYGVKPEFESQFQVIGTKEFLDYINTNQQKIQQFLKEVKKNPFKNSVDDYLKSQNPQKAEKAKRRRTVVAVTDGLFPSSFPPLAVKAMGPFLKSSETQGQEPPENLIHQYTTMRDLFESWQAFPELLREIIRPVEVYGVIIDNEGNQFLFMEQVKGVKKGMLTIYKGKGADGGEYQGFDVRRHPRLFGLIRRWVDAKEITLGTRVDTQGNQREICSLVYLENVFKALGVELKQLIGKDILWTDNEAGIREYRIIDMRSHNFRRKKE